MLDVITPLILTYNEGSNIERTLNALRWARDIVVVDSLSTDGTAEIVRHSPQARLFERPFDSHAAQWNFALSCTHITTEWVLALDADYVVTEELKSEIAMLKPKDVVAGYRAGFIYCVKGKLLRGSLYPPVTVLYRRAKAHYRQEGHTQRVIIGGELEMLSGKLLHDDRKPLSRWYASQQKYAWQEAEHLLTADRSTCTLADRIRLAVWPAPIMVFVYTLIVKRCLLDGWPGWFYALQRLLAETMIALAILDRRLTNGHKGDAR